MCLSVAHVVFKSSLYVILTCSLASTPREELLLYLAPHVDLTLEDKSMV